MSTDLLEMKRSLTPQDLEILRSELDRMRKSVGLAYALWFFFSFLGLHKFYLGKVGQGLFYLLGPWLALLVFGGGAVGGLVAGDQGGGAFALLLGMLALLVGIVALVGFMVWWVVDMFTLHRQTEAANEKIERSILLRMRRSRSA